MRLSLFCGFLLLTVTACGDDDDDSAKPDAAMHGDGGSGGRGSGGAGSGSGGSTQPGTGGHGGAHDAGAMHDAANGDDAGLDDDGGTAQPCSIDASDANLPGVKLHVESDRCRIPFGEGQHFTWKLVLKDPIDYTTMDSGGTCGHCGTGNDADATALVDYAIEGGAQHYCICDVGCCQPTTAHAAQLAAGNSSAEIDWPGRQWTGPSDTNQPYGDFFPVGHYTVDVTFAVPDVGSVTAKLPIDVVPRSSGSQTCPSGQVYGKSCLQCGPTDACEQLIEGCLPACMNGSECEEHGGGSCVGGVCRMVCG